MNLERITRIIEHEIEQAAWPEELTDNRSKALDYYHGRPRGDERDGRSAVVSQDVSEAINWIMPDVVETFIASDEIVSFDPVGEEDEEQAEQETDYINYVMRKENDAFTVYNEWFQDALLQKNGYVKVYRDEDKEEQREEYADVGMMELAQLEGDGWEVAEANETGADEFGPRFDVVVERVQDKSKTTFECVAPEELKVNRDHSSVDLSKARFVAHDRNMPRHELLELGFDKAEVWSLPTDSVDISEDAIARDSLDQDDYSAEIDTAMQEVSVQECYVRLDAEENGKVRLYQVWYSNSKILSIEEFDFIPFACLTPRILSHNHNGESIYDKLKQIQDQKTSIWRQTLDNMYAMNNQRTYVNTKAKVNMGDLLASRIGGVVRGQGPMMEALSPIPTLPIAGDSFAMLDYLDRVRAQRAGVDPENKAHDSMKASNTAEGLNRLMTDKEKVIGLIVRTFAETGIKQLVTMIRRIESKYQDAEKVVRLRGKWVPVNPSEWRDRMNTTIMVGLGAGDEAKQLGAMEYVFSLQDKLMAGGYPFITPKNIDAALEDFGKLSKLPTTRQYFTDPESEEGMAIQEAQSQPQPDPNMELLQLQAQVEQAKIELEREKLAWSKEKDVFEAQSKGELAQAKQAQENLEAEQKLIKLLADIEAAKEELEIKRGKLALDEQELELEARTTEIELAKAQRDEEINLLQSRLGSMGSVLEAIQSDRDNSRQVLVEHFAKNPRLAGLIERLGNAPI